MRVSVERWNRNFSTRSRQTTEAAVSPGTTWRFDLRARPSQVFTCVLKDYNIGEIITLITGAILCLSLSELPNINFYFPYCEKRAPAPEKYATLPASEIKSSITDISL